MSPEKIRLFHKAAARGDIEDMERLLAPPPSDSVEHLFGRLSINATSEKGSHTATFYAALNGHNEALKWLVQHGAMIDIRGFHKDKQGKGWYSATEIAALKGHVDCLDTCLETHAARRGVRYQAGEDYALLISSIMRGKVDVVRYFLADGVPADFPEPVGSGAETPIPPLWIAVEVNPPATAMIDLLLDAGANIEARHPKKNSSALCLAAQQGKLEVLTRLLDQGASPEGGTEHQVYLFFGEQVTLITPPNPPKNPLCAAIDSIENPKILDSVVELLLDHYANPNVGDSHWTPLAKAQRENVSASITRRLVEAGAEIAPGAIQHAVSWGRTDNLRYFMEQGAKLPPDNTLFFNLNIKATKAALEAWKLWAQTGLDSTSKEDDPPSLHL